MATIRHAVIDQEIDDDIAGTFRAKADYLANTRRNAGMLHESFVVRSLAHDRARPQQVPCPL